MNSTTVTAHSALEILLTPDEVAEALGLKKATLAQQRTQGRGITYTKVGSVVRYALSDVQEYLEANTVRPPHCD